MRTSTAIAGLILALLVAGCGKKEDSVDLKEIKLQRLVRGFVEKSLKDPGSAEFRNQYGICGEVNAKNSFGGYTGFKRFIAGSEALVIMEGGGALSESDFSSLWSQTCSKSPSGALKG